MHLGFVIKKTLTLLSPAIVGIVTGYVSCLSGVVVGFFPLSH